MITEVLLLLPFLRGSPNHSSFIDTFTQHIFTEAL